jgi:hypothetical protein
MNVKSFQFADFIVKENGNSREDNARVFDDPEFAAARAKVGPRSEQMHVFILGVELAIVLFENPFN